MKRTQFAAMAQRDPASVFMLGLFGDRAKAELAVHEYYRSIVQVGHDTDFAFAITTRSTGLPEIPEENLSPKEIVTQFSDVEGASDAAWIEEIEVT